MYFFFAHSGKSVTVAIVPTALELAPENYIYRRRLQQYGPLLGKPYPFYDWIAQARADIAARGETPVPLVVEPGLTESLGKADPIGADERKEPDLQGRLPRDDGLVAVEATVVPSTLEPGAPARVHLRFTPSAARKAHWDHDADGAPQIWLHLPEGWERSPIAPAHAYPDRGQSAEERVYEFELRLPKSARKGTVTGYATYGVCEDEDGTCRFLRHDLEIEIAVTR